MMDLRLDADLVVLSACETGRGRIAPGEGIVGTMWALFVAGIAGPPRQPVEGRVGEHDGADDRLPPRRSRAAKGSMAGRPEAAPASSSCAARATRIRSTGRASSSSATPIERCSTRRCAGFVDATDDAEAERRLAVLLEEEAEPLIRQIVGRKLGAHGRRPLAAGPRGHRRRRAAGPGLRGCRRCAADPTAAPIESFADYTATVAYNTFAHYLRRRHPERSRLKNRLRYVLTRDRRLALWPTPDGLACGLAAWRAACRRAPPPP